MYNTTDKLGFGNNRTDNFCSIVRNRIIKRDLAHSCSSSNYHLMTRKLTKTAETFKRLQLTKTKLRADENK